MSSQTARQVLIVDNNEDVLAHLAKSLTQAGYETTTTWSGVEALKLLESCGFDSLLVDDYLPDLYIGEFLKRLSNFHFRPRVFVMSIRGASVVENCSSAEFTCVDKRCVSEILRALDDAGKIGSSSQRWTN